MLRSRTMGVIEPVTLVYKTMTCAGVLTSSSNTGNYYDKGSRKVTTDVVGVNYHQRRREGEIIVNPFSTEEEKREVTGFYWKITRTGSCSGSTVQWQDGDAYVPIMPAGARYCPALIPDNIRSRLILGACTQALAGARRPDVAGLVELAEMKQIPGIWSGPVRRLNKVASDTIKVLDKIERGTDYQKYCRTFGKSLGKFIADGWLTYRYGLLPLIQSGEDSIKALKEETDRKVRRISRSSKHMDADQESHSDSTGGSNFDVSRAATSRHEMSVVAGVYYEMLLSRMGQFGTTAMDVPETAWELIPYSFVVDWFVNVGDLIATLPRPGQKVLATWHGIRDIRETKVSHTAVWKNVVNYTPTTLPHGMATYTVVRYNRMPYITTGLTPRVNPFGDFDSKLKTDRIGDAIALIVGKLTEGFSPGITRSRR